MLAFIKSYDLILFLNAQTDRELDDHKNDRCGNSAVDKGYQRSNDLRPELTCIPEQKALAEPR